MNRIAIIILSFTTLAAFPVAEAKRSKSKRVADNCPVVKKHVKPKDRGWQQVR